MNRGKEIPLDSLRSTYIGGDPITKLPWYRDWTWTGLAWYAGGLFITAIALGAAWQTGVKVYSYFYFQAESSGAATQLVMMVPVIQ